jgi:lysophospholipase L1-like esterase
VAAIGDSLTDPRSGGGRYMRALARACPASRFDTYGVGGQQTRHMLWRVRQDLFGEGRRGAPPKPRYTHVLVLGGINDITGAEGHVPDVARIEKNLTGIYAAAREHGAKVIGLTIAPWGWGQAPRAQLQATTRLNTWLRSGAAGALDQTVDIHPHLSCGEPLFLCPDYRMLPGDHVHWNERGHQIVAGSLEREVFQDCE